MFWITKGQILRMATFRRNTGKCFYSSGTKHFPRAENWWNETSVMCRSNVYGLQRVNAAGGHYLEGGTYRRIFVISDSADSGGCPARDHSLGKYTGKMRILIFSEHFWNVFGEADAKRSLSKYTGKMRILIFPGHFWNVFGEADAKRSNRRRSPGSPPDRDVHFYSVKNQLPHDYFQNVNFCAIFYKTIRFPAARQNRAPELRRIAMSIFTV